MSDVSHVVGFDLTLSPTGDLAAVSDANLGQQRVLRRLLTNPGDYIWNLAYGAGLPGMVGNISQPTAIRGLITSQMLQESAVAQSPLPRITVSSDNASTVYAYVQYVDSTTGASQVLNVPLSRS